MSNLLLGYHVSKSSNGKTQLMSKSLLDASKHMTARGWTNLCFQIFVTGPQSFHNNILDDETACRKTIYGNNITVVVHGAYVSAPWGNSQGAIHNIKEEMRMAAAIGATGVIIHLGAGACDDEQLCYVLNEIGNLPTSVLSNVILWLEINAAKPSEHTFETPKKLSKLFSRIDKLKPKLLRVGLCVDTAHLYSCGVCLDSKQAAQQWLSGLSAIENIPFMFHLNDSASELGSGRDRHAGLCRGNIWEGYENNIVDSGLLEILTWCEDNKAPVILERDPITLNKDLKLLERLGFN